MVLDLPRPVRPCRKQDEEFAEAVPVLGPPAGLGGRYPSTESSFLGRAWQMGNDTSRATSPLKPKGGLNGAPSSPDRSAEFGFVSGHDFSRVA